MDIKVVEVKGELSHFQKAVT